MPRVLDTMHREVQSCTPDAPLTEACRIMWEMDCGIVPVIEPASRKLLGVLTDRDVSMTAFMRGQRLDEITVHEAMNANLHTCKESEELEKAHEAMRTFQLRRLPVVDEQGKLKGMITLNDLAVHASTSKNKNEKLDVADTLGAISRHRVEARPLATV